MRSLGGRGGGCGSGVVQRRIGTRTAWRGDRTGRSCWSYFSIIKQHMCRRIAPVAARGTVPPAVGLPLGAAADG